jgi:long-chain acyl-CoA synthetase
MVRLGVATKMLNFQAGLKDIPKSFLSAENLKLMQTPLEKFYHWERTAPEKIFLRQPVQGDWKIYTYRQAGEEIRKIAMAIHALNLRPGSKIALLSKNCAHWIMADLAIWMSGNITVPLYPTVSADTIRLILDHSESAAIFVGKLDDYNSQKSGIPESVIKLTFPFYGVEDALQWDTLLEKNNPYPGEFIPGLQDLATITYTSGTTGIPKGVMMTFESLSYSASLAIDQIHQAVGIPKHPRLFSYLPLSHVAERMVIALFGLYEGGMISFAESLDTFGKNLADTQPNLFFGVPRIWAKFQEKILEKMPQRKLDRLINLPLVGMLVKKKIQKALGLSKSIINLSGAAPIPPELLLWYKKLGIVIREVYGMTENCALSHINLEKIKIGTVGTAWPGIETRISSEGEIQTRHPGTMLGYYKAPELTKEIFTEDGFLKTGDQGAVDNEGFLTITGRIKDLFKTDKGKYVAPAPIEMMLLKHADIEQVCVVGMGIPQPIALTVLSASGRTKPRETINAGIIDLLKGINPLLEHHERIEKAIIMNEGWTIENNLMTPTLKVKRNEVEKIHLPKYPTWYNRSGIVLWETDLK